MTTTFITGANKSLGLKPLVASSRRGTPSSSVPATVSAVGPRPSRSAPGSFRST